MKDKLINDFMQKLLDYASNLEKFVGKEVPAYIKELLQYRAFESYTEIAISSLVIFGWLVALFTTYKIIKFGKKWKWEEGTQYVPFIICVVCSTGFIPCQISDIKNEALNIYKINNAPRVYIIDYLRRVK